MTRHLERWRGAVAAGVVAAAGLCGGCRMYSPSPRLGANVPVPATAGPEEVGVQTLSLRYSLPGDREPALVSLEQIEILDESGRVCPPRSFRVGRGAEGYWTSINFMFPPTATRITARFQLRVDTGVYPLSAILTRMGDGNWRADYGVVPPPR